jgi:uncharacterized protein involved in exopolysaccharide biosynthesis
MSLDSENATPLVRSLTSLRRHWITALVVTTLGVLAASGWAFLVSPIYRSEVTVSVLADDASPSGLAAIASQFLGPSQNPVLPRAGAVGRQEVIARLQSISLLTDFIKSAGLEREIDEHFFVETLDSVEPESHGDRAIQLAARSFARHAILVREDRRTGLVVVAINWPDPSRAAELANSYIAFADHAIRTEKVRELDATIEGLAKILASAGQVEIKQALLQTYASNLQSRLLAQAQRSFALRVLDPAIPPSRSKPVSPNRPFVILSGFFIGALMAVLVCVLLDRRLTVAPSKVVR